MTREELKNKLALLFLEKDIEFSYNIIESGYSYELRSYFSFTSNTPTILMNNIKITNIADITFKDDKLEIADNISIDYEDILTLEVL